MATPILQSAIAGPFVANWVRHISFGPNNAEHSTTFNLGLIGERGIREIRRYESEEITADLLGASVVDAVYLGSQLFLEFELESANLLAVMQISHPFTGVEVDNPGTLAQYLLNEGALGVPGQFYTHQSGSLLLYPAYGVGGNALNTAGAQLTPVRRYEICTLAPGFEINKLLSARRRVVPIRLRCFPYRVGNDYCFYTKHSS